MLLKEAMEKFIHYLVMTDKSKETIRSYSIDLTNFDEFLEKKYNCPLYLNEVQVTDIEDYLYHLKKRNLQTSTRSRNLYTLRSFWNYTYKNKMCNFNLALAVEPIKIQKKERTYLSTEEAFQLMDAVEHPLIQLVIKTLYYTGLRISECLNLKLDDLDIKNKVIHVIGGKGNKNRDIPINQNLLPLLENYLNYEREDIDSDYLFATKKTGHLSSAYVNSVLRDTVKNLGWKKHVTAHILRHSFASNLIKNGVNLVYVQKLLGHSNLKVTSIYTHANMEDLDRSINLL
ncbi:tyrosine-type recombinase/integrase [Clostridium sp. MB40-C1]|uniref:site-specific tyrosine recombinase/integron integrase n=1 Tax=Clostridium sp. MB40-C1 TaxID=3070996 RepID=UPI0027E1822B|nr:site-specific tyrosine recombinase/integron integrase [Clostridium sp. MB40-C1]WMJ80790.1 tyrosine-type recombinase/integrase [Clostridium sp. MB40-C1]